MNRWIEIVSTQIDEYQHKLSFDGVTYVFLFPQTVCPHYRGSYGSS